MLKNILDIDVASAQRLTNISGDIDCIFLFLWESPEKFLAEVLGRMQMICANVDASVKKSEFGAYSVRNAEWMFYRLVCCAVLLQNSSLPVHIYKIYLWMDSNPWSYV